MRWHHYTLATPHGAGRDDRVRASTSSTARSGFRNDGADPTVLANGTFLNPGPVAGDRR